MDFGAPMEEQVHYLPSALARVRSLGSLNSVRTGLAPWFIEGGSYEVFLLFRVISYQHLTIS